MNCLCNKLLILYSLWYSSVFSLKFYHLDIATDFGVCVLAWPYQTVSFCKYSLSNSDLQWKSTRTFLYLEVLNLLRMIIHLVSKIYICNVLVIVFYTIYLIFCIHNGLRKIILTTKNEFCQRHANNLLMI